MKTLTYLACILAATSFVSCNSVPVLLWGVSKESISVPALHQLAENEFSSIIAAKLKAETFTVVFQERKLSTEDLNCKLSSGGTCFKSLSQISQKSYLPSVENPIDTLKKDFGSFVDHYVKSDGELNEPIVPVVGASVFIQFDAAVEGSFAEHDLIIKRISEQILADYPDTFFIYTAKSSSNDNSAHLIRKQRAVPTPRQADTREGQFFEHGNLLIFLTHLSFRAGPGQVSTIVNITDVEVTNSTSDAITATLTDGIHRLVFTVTHSAGNWMIREMTFDDINLYMRHSISANMGFSYHCSRGAEFPRPDFTQYVTIGWQIQPNFAANTELKAFGEPFDCVGFTSAGIWGGLFVTFLLIVILTYGISWMLDIKTMDRFDDPKGKTIIVSATD